MKPKVLAITPIQHIPNVVDSLKSFSDLTIINDPSSEELRKIISGYDAIFTNPNKSKIFLGKDILSYAPNLLAIATASTGTNHIDKDYALSRNINVFSLTEEREVIRKISSTAEHAFALTLSSMRRLIQSHNQALDGEWDYTKYIGRQMNFLTIGIIGYGRLGSLYADYCKAFGSKIIVYDPYKEINVKGIKQVSNIQDLLSVADVISLHVHVNKETTNMINYDVFSKIKNDVLIVNTSRGEIVNETDLVNFLGKNHNARYATDVLTNEIRDRESSPLFKYAKNNDGQVIITQHIGGMTIEAQQIAYNHAAKMLGDYFAKNKIT